MLKLHAFALASVTLALSASAAATPFVFSTGAPDGRIGTASRPASAGKIEIETGDDFRIFGPTGLTNITGATFTGLLTGTTPTVSDVRVEIYRIFPKDSDEGRTSGPPTFSTPLVRLERSSTAAPGKPARRKPRKKAAAIPAE